MSTVAKWMRRSAQIAPVCQMGLHDICDEKTADFLADYPEAAPFDCHCNCHIDRYIADLSRARSVAAALEQELALKNEAIEQIAALTDMWLIDSRRCSRCARDALRILDALAARLEAADEAYDQKEKGQ